MEDEQAMMSYLKKPLLPLVENDETFYRELLFAVAILIGYLLVLTVAAALPDSSSLLMTTLFPNIWLLGMTLYFKKRQITELFVLKKIHIGLLVYAYSASLAVTLFCYYSQKNYPIKLHISVQPEQALAALFIVILAPMAEELFFRGYLLRLFSVHFDKTYSVILVSVLFYFLHIRTGSSFEMLCLSCLLCLLVLYTNSLVPALITHISWNGVSQITTIQSMPVRWFIVTAAVTGIAATIFAGAKLNDQLSDK